PGGPDTPCIAAAMSAPSVEPAASAESASRITASKFWASYVWRDPLSGFDFQSASNAAPAGASRDVGTVPRIPSVVSLPASFGRSDDRRPSPVNVLAGSHLPVRTSAGPSFGHVPV